MDSVRNPVRNPVRIHDSGSDSELSFSRVLRPQRKMRVNHKMSTIRDGNMETFKSRIYCCLSPRWLGSWCFCYICDFMCNNSAPGEWNNSEVHTQKILQVRAASRACDATRSTTTWNNLLGVLCHNYPLPLCVDDSYIQFCFSTIIGSHKTGVDTNLKVICVYLQGRHNQRPPTGRGSVTWLLRLHHIGVEPRAGAVGCHRGRPRPTALRNVV